MNDESIDVNISFINTDYFSVSVRDGCISVIGRINKLEMEKFIKAQYFEIKEILDKNAHTSSCGVSDMVIVYLVSYKGKAII